MSGFDLILNAALCLSCAQPNLVLPSNFIRLENSTDLMEDYISTTTTSPSSTNIDEEALEGPSQTIETVKYQKKYLRELREWINGKHLRIATLEDYPLSYTEEVNNKRIGLGVAFTLVNFLQQKYNFTYEVVVPEANIIGSTGDSRGSLIEMLNRTKADLHADMAAAFIPLLADARNYMFYSTTTLDEGVWIMVMQRPHESAKGSGLLAPFDFAVWILILVSLLIVGPVIYFLIILRNKLTGDTEQKPYSLSHCAWFVYGALMKQGSTLSPVADSTRLLFATWWIFITILTSFYTANLTAFLTLSKFTLPYNTYQDLLAKNKHFVSARGGGVEYAIRNTNETLSVLNIMIQKNYAVFSDLTNDTDNLQKYVEKDGFVFVRDRPAINHVLYKDYRYRKTINLNDEKIHCPFATAKVPFLKKMRSFAYPIGSNLSLLFDPELLNLVESGIIKHLSTVNVTNAEICPQNLGGTERQLRNTDLLMTYYIMFAGFATSIVVFTTELLFRFLNSRRDRNKDNQWARHGVGRTPNGQMQFAPKRWLRKQVNGDKDYLTAKAISGANITPPPPYQSIFSQSKNASNNGSNNNDSNGQRWRRAAALGAAGVNGNSDSGFVLGHGNQGASGVRRLINGRDYMVFRNPNGQSQLVPMRAPSAALFQYTYTE